ncbi:MAG: phospholipase D-like domain-containing protein [Phycisphaerae bacterium]|nr:phospholipase D-like domain-containing protein [Phycisphaerae bacterium]
MLLMFSLIQKHLFLLMGIGLGIVLVVHILLQRQSPAVTLAWLLAILFMPYVGVPLYLVLSGRKVRHTTAKKGWLDLTGIELPSSEGTGPVRRLLRAYGVPGPCANNKFELLGSGEEVYRSLIRLIEEAQNSIYIAIYAFNKDPIAEDIRYRLAEKAMQGVDVRLLLDGVGSLHTHRRFFHSLTKAGGHLAYFIPLLHRPFRGRTNLRNHRKIALFDNKCVLSGGRNIGTEYMGPSPTSDRWHDLSFVLHGPAVKHYAKVFRADWEFAADEVLEPISSIPPCDLQSKALAAVQVVPSGPDVPHDALYDAIITTAFNAEQRLWIASPYFVPDQALAQALEIAAQRGVDVRIIVPAKSNYAMADMVRGRYLRNLQQASAKIYLYLPRMMHAKILLKDDDLAMIGTANMDVRSLFLDYEIAAFFYDIGSIKAIESWMNDTFRDCRQGVKDASILRNLLEAVIHIMAPMF